MSQAEVEKGKAHFMETLGNIPEPIRAMIDHAPDFFPGYLRMREWIYQKRPGGLDLKTKELIYVLLDIVTGNLDGANNHAAAAVKAGLTSTELMDACMQVYHVCGITTWGKTGYKVVDFVAELEKQAELKR
jgi:AhpD family alkylhydroperoxidase